MDIWNKHKSPLGYYNNSNQIDSYGVNHSGFNTGDELNYQSFRQDKDNKNYQYFGKGWDSRTDKYHITY